MHGFTYTLHLLEPVLANSLTGDANTAKSLPFVPGALIRGALIHAFQEKHNRRQFDVGEDDQARRLFFSGQTRYLHVYPRSGKFNKRALPAPLSWQRRKQFDQARGESAGNRELFDLSIHPDERANEKHLTGLGGEHFFVVEGSFRPFEAEREGEFQTPEIAYWTENQEQLHVHTQRDAVLGRAKEDGRGAVFRYESLPTAYKFEEGEIASLVFEGVIITETDDDARTIKELIGGRRITLGKSRSAGYGLAEIEVKEDLPADWREAGNADIVDFVSTSQAAQGLDSQSEYSDEDGADEGIDYATELPAEAAQILAPPYQEFTLTMLSETILRDDYGQHTLDPLPELERKLGERYKLTKDAERSFRKIEIVGGFNRKWGLPLPQVNAIAAGSVFFIHAEPAIEAQALKKLQSDLQTHGLGERRVDGFGRVAIEWYNDNPKRWQKEEFSPSNGGNIQQAASLSQEEEELAKLMLRRMLERELDDRLQTAVGKLTVKGDVPNSQLSRWRSAVQSALGEQSPVRRAGRVIEFLAREEQKGSAAWEKMRRAKVLKNKNELGRLTEWIKAVLDGKGSPWSQLDYPNNEPPQRSLGKVTVKADDLKISTEYRLRLIDALLNRIAKGKTKPDNEGGKNA